MCLDAHFEKYLYKIKTFECITVQALINILKLKKSTLLNYNKKCNVNK